ncbi:MAG TPA: preprotein translocase subunit SecG [Candidatus Angelobacter sp.]|jgi:preprotein translocase subunit SecG
MLTALITVIHVIVCAVLIVVVLLQHGKSADIAATFGGMGSQTAFGPRGTATVFSRLTTWCAIIFMLTSMALTYISSLHTSTSVMDSVSTPVQQSQPAPKK